MSGPGDAIPTVGAYRGIGIHSQQPVERIDYVVKPALDQVLVLADEHDLFAVARDPAQPPEARLLAAAKITAMHEMAAEARQNRPGVDLAKVRAAVAGLNSQRWRDRRRYCSLLDFDQRRAMKREEPLP